MRRKIKNNPVMANLSGWSATWCGRRARCDRIEGSGTGTGDRKLGRAGGARPMCQR